MALAALGRLVYLLVGLLAGAAALVTALLVGGETAARLRERRGLWQGWPDSESGQDWVWIHAASVGEAEMALALASALAERRPGLRIVVSAMTEAGLARLRRDQRVESHYFPIDFPVFLKRVVDPFPPRLFVAVETEIWPEALRLLQARGAATAVVNARISDRTWPRYRLVRPLLAPVLGRLALVAARDAESARRWVALGASDRATSVTGNMKFDLAVPRNNEDIPSLIEDVHGAPIVLAASTHEGEDDLVLDAFAEVRSRHPDARLLLAPRHPRRAGSLLAEARSRWLAAVAWSDVVGIAGAARSPAELASRPAEEAATRDGAASGEVDGTPRSAAAVWPARVDVIVLDRIGLLRSAYAAATACLVGGSLVEGPGGHNLLEPAVALCPAAAGPHRSNVADQESILGDTRALTVVRDSRGLSKFWLQVIENPAQWTQDLRAARSRIEERCGALDRNAGALVELLGPLR